jgi:hypothetical protein
MLLEELFIMIVYNFKMFVDKISNTEQKPLAKKDEEKIAKVIEQNKVKLYVLLEQHLTKEYILSLCS